MNYLDPNSQIFEGRYYRNHCYTTLEKVHIKDIRLFMTPSTKYRTWKIEEIVIVDNAAHSFGFQIDNGIPMLPFYYDKQDKEMIHLMFYLKKIYKSDGMSALKILFVLLKI